MVMDIFYLTKMKLKYRNILNMILSLSHNKLRQQFCQDQVKYYQDLYKQIVEYVKGWYMVYIEIKKVYF